MLSCNSGPGAEGTKGDPPLLDSLGNTIPQKKYMKESSTVGDITIVVDETLQPIIEEEIETFMFRHKRSKIKAIYLPGEEAIQAMLNSDTLRLVVSSRELTYDEEQMLLKQKTKARPSLIATDAISIIINKANLDSTLSLQHLKGILSGEIKDWKEINPASKLGEIILAFDHAQSSTVQYVQSDILGDVPLREDVVAGKSNPEVLEYVGKNKNAIGITGVSWISDRDDKTAAVFKENITVMALEKSGDCSYEGTYFQPYQGYIHQKCYPFTRGIYAVLREARIGLGTGFVAFLASDPGQRIFHKAGLVPERGITRVVKLPPKEKVEAQRKAQKSKMVSK